MKSSPLPRMLFEVWRRVEPKWSRKVSSAERNNCDVTAAPRIDLVGPFGSPVFARARKHDPPSSSYPLAELGGHEGADLIDDARALTDKPLAHPVQRLQVELVAVLVATNF